MGESYLAEEILFVEQGWEEVPLAGGQLRLRRHRGAARQEDQPPQHRAAAANAESGGDGMLIVAR